MPWRHLTEGPWRMETTVEVCSLEALEVPRRLQPTRKLCSSGAIRALQNLQRLLVKGQLPIPERDGGAATAAGVAVDRKPVPLVELLLLWGEENVLK